MSLSVNVRRVQGRPGPERALIFSCEFKWYGEDAFLLAFEGRLSWGDPVLSERVCIEKMNWSNGSLALLRREHDVSGTLIAPLSNNAIEYIEKRRMGKDVPLQLRIYYQYQKVVTPGTQEPGQRQLILGGEVRWIESNASLDAIPHSEWLKRLKEMSWSEIELFEVHRLPLEEDENLGQALRLLKEAEKSLRSGNWKDAIAGCRRAFESAAKYEAQGDMKKGFELLLARALPEHEAKQAATNAVIKALSEYAHTLGRHEQYPALDASREEAEFAFTSTISLFSLLSRRLSKRKETS
jgi:hypothetical protein